MVVDPGFSPEAVHGLLAAARKTPVAVLATHAHVDHVGEAGDFAGEVPVFVHEADAVAFTDEPAWRAGFANPLAPVKELRTIADGDVLHLAGLEIEVMHTPGHTPGTLLLPRRPRRRDLLGRPRVRWIDRSLGLPELRSRSAMQASLRRFLELPDAVPVLPGARARDDRGP